MGKLPASKEKRRIFSFEVEDLQYGKSQKNDCISPVKDLMQIISFFVKLRKRPKLIRLVQRTQVGCKSLLKSPENKPNI